MKDKLRELVRSWDAYRDEPFTSALLNSIEKILDAEGDGGAVAWMSPNKERLEFSRPDTVYGSHTIPLYTHHARSGGVSDGDVDRFIAALKNKGLELIFAEDRPYIRAALEHFAKGEPK